MSNISLFAQILGKQDRNIFKKLIDKYDSDKHTKGFSS